MNTTVPRTLEEIDEGTRDAALAAARRSGLSLGEWLDRVISERSATASIPSTTPTDHAAEMEAIAEQLARLSESGAPGDRSTRRTGTRPEPGFDASAAIRKAVAEITKRQGDLDRHSEAPAADDDKPTPSRPEAHPNEPATDRDARATIPNLSGPPPRWSMQLEDAISRSSLKAREPLGSRRPGADLSKEVSQTFARFSREMHDAIQATDARPKVDSLDRQMRRMARTVDGLGQNMPSAESLDRIGEQTREMRDLLRASSDRALPLDAVEQQVSLLEQRLSHLADLPVGAIQPPHLDETMREVRALLDGFKPGVTMTALESRLNDITSRIEQGLAAQGPNGLMEGLSRRVDEIHATLQTKLADTSVDTRPLEGLVRGLSDRLGQAHEASSDLEHLETTMREVAAKIDAAAGDQDPRGVQAVEAQLIRLTERLDRSDASLRALDGVEQTLGQLFSQFEVTRQVAIDAAETAARTAARDTLRGALQSPGLAARVADTSPGLAEQVSRGLEELRALQDSAQRRTETTLLDLRDMMERLTQDTASTFTDSRRRTASDDARRRRPETAAEPRLASDPSDILIEPGLGRAPVSPIARPEARSSTASGEVEIPVGPVEESDGPASFIAAARRAAKAAQASAASTAGQTGGERRSAPPRAERQRTWREPVGAAAGSPGALVQAKAFIARRRRPILLGLAALVLLVGALEVLKLGVTPSDDTHVGAAQMMAPGQTKTAALESPPAAAKAPTAVLPPATAPVTPPLPTFVAGVSKPQAAPDGIGEGLRSLASAGNAAAQYEIGLRYAEGRGVARDPKQALAWFDKSAAQGSAPAQYRLGSAYEKGVGLDRDPALAMAWYGKAADAGNIRAMHNLAVMSAEGAVGKPDYAKAAQWFGKASEFGVRDSQFNLAILYARGLGIEQSLGQSYKWFAIAASEGDDDAAKKRDEVAAKLDPVALSSAKAAVAGYHAAVPQTSSNDVAPPTGGWDAAASRLPNPSSAAKVSQL
ncbi:MAG: tetratricopeptide repeat protein [Janthinobacterium lividum]